ncbi:hypothetical protein [Sphingomonas sp. NIBR02145]|nr:hypothetical protein [Sphingomonas sp. NIBR02145]WHU03495.1 hypothetical protein O3305_02500 [Sphingomonas sp. NIBR02145]
MRAIIEGIGALFGMPVSERYGGHRRIVLLTILAVAATAAFALLYAAR